MAASLDFVKVTRLQWLALNYLVNNISSAIYSCEITVSVFLDLSKPFDTLDHQILFLKLKSYGIRGMAPSYFSVHLQFVQFN